MQFRFTAVASALLIAACAGEQRELPVAETPMAARTESAGADTLSAPIVTMRGIGRLEAGMTVQEAALALGDTLRMDPGSEIEDCSYAAWGRAPAGVSIMIIAGRVARIDVEQAGVRTIEGAAVGDTEARIRQLYAGRVSEDLHKYDDNGKYLTVTTPSDSSVSIIFETHAGIVTRYRAGRLPEVGYVEGCA